MQASLDDTVQDAVEGLEPEQERPQFVNELAWYDEDPRVLYVDRGSRGQVQRLEARLLAYPIEPDPPIELNPTRVEEFFNEGLGASLLALQAGDAVHYVTHIARSDGSWTYILRHEYNGRPVDDSTLAVDVSAAGELTRLTSSVVPGLDYPTGATLPESEARTAAEQAVVGSGDPTWQGATGFADVEQPEIQVIWMMPWTRDDAARLAWRFLFDRDDGYVAARREVLIDALDGSIIGQESHAALMLSPHDEIHEVDSFIGGEGMEQPAPISLLWQGGDDCLGTADDWTAPESAPFLERDEEEAAAALCEAVNLFEMYGGELTGGWHTWLDHRDTGVKLGIGAAPGLSVAQNLGSMLAFAEGVGRAEVVGHELFHSVLGRGNAPEFAFSEYNGLGEGIGGAEGDAVEEHLADVFGTLLERRFDHRNENTCLLNDDDNSKEAQGAQDLNPAHEDFAYRPCGDEMVDREWRSICEPDKDNAGWCQGPLHYTDIGYSRYDAYGDEVDGPTGHVASHTNLGIGNRVWAALLGETEPSLRFDVDPTSEETVLELLVGLATEMGEHTDWAAYGRDLATEANDRDGGPMSMGPLETSVRNGLESVGLWSYPRSIEPQLGGAPSTIKPTALDRPAAATVELTGGDAGGARTFVFYRPSDSSTALEYVWRDEPAGGDAATLGSSWTGPCELSMAQTETGAAAVGRDDGLFLVWAEPTGTPEVGTLRGAKLEAPDVGEDTECDFDFQSMDPPEERLVRGQPAIESFDAHVDRTQCDVLESALPGVAFPFRTEGAMGISLGDCGDVIERIPTPASEALPELGGPLWEVLGPMIQEDPGRVPPAAFDPDAPRPTETSELVHRIPVFPLAAEADGTQAELEGLEYIGDRFTDSFGAAGLPRSTVVEVEFPWTIEEWSEGVPKGSMETIALTFAETVLMVAFRDRDDVLRLAPFDDPRATDDLPVVDPSPTGDPALAQTKRRVSSGGMRLDLSYLHVLYGTEEIVDGAVVPTRLSHRSVVLWDPANPLEDGHLEPPVRIDSIEGTHGIRRKIDYGFIRTLQGPVVAADRDKLHVFVVAMKREPNVNDGDGISLGPNAVAGVDSEVDQQRPANVDRVRHAVLRARQDGTLSSISERPVYLTRTKLDTSDYDYDFPAPTDESHPLNQTQAGTALAVGRRDFVRWFYPTRAALTVRTVRSP